MTHGFASSAAHGSLFTNAGCVTSDGAGSALYGMLDVLLAAGNIWQTLVRTNSADTLFRVRIISPTGEPFACGNGIPVRPELSVEEDPETQIVILPELWLGPDEHLQGRYPELMDWIRRQHERGASIYSACSGAVMLAETGLLDQCEATSHWGYQDLFRKYYPNVRFRPEPNLEHPTVSSLTQLCIPQKRIRMVPRRGLEPPRPFDHWHLKPARLPIPPPGH